MSIMIKCSHENISLPFKKLLSPLIHTIAMRSGLQLRWVIFRSQLETQSSLFSPWFMAREEGRMNTMRPWYTLKSPFAPNATGHMLFLCSYTDVLHTQTIIKFKGWNHIYRWSSLKIFLLLSKWFYNNVLTFILFELETKEIC